jgi:hypothetical protein
MQSNKDNIKPDILPKAGAGQEGTDELANTYKNDTPGQQTKRIASIKFYLKHK